MDKLAFALQWPGKLVFGAGRLATLGDEVKSLGRRAFLATTRELVALGLADHTMVDEKAVVVEVKRAQAGGGVKALR
jgi:alcohol dehydrogenase class IV